MLHNFKIYGQRYAIDTDSGAIHKLTELQTDMLRYLKLPFESAFPSSLRYDLAKYESEKLKAAYLELRKLWLDGVFMSDTPSALPSIEPAARDFDKEVQFSGVKPVFASEVIKLADAGSEILSAVMSTDTPVKECDYDIVEGEYERIAKEIIKRVGGRVPFPAFTFIPFELDFAVDGNGYTHLVTKDKAKVFEGGTTVDKKLVECAIAVYFAKNNI